MTPVPEHPQNISCPVWPGHPYSPQRFCGARGPSESHITSHVCLLVLHSGSSGLGLAQWPIIVLKELEATSRMITVLLLLFS